MEDYKKRLLNEYLELKERYDKLHKFLIKYEAGTLGDIKLVTPIGVLGRQENLMWAYLKVLELRLEYEEIEVTK